MASDNQTLRVGLVVKSPFVEDCVLLDPDNCNFTGISFGIFLYVAQLLDYKSLTLIPSKKDLSGPVNGVWGGLVGSLQQGNVDASASLLEVTNHKELLKAIDFSIPVTTSKTGLIMATPVRPPWNLFSVFEPFTSSVWLCVITVALVLRILLYGFSTYKPGLSPSLKLLLVVKAFMFNFMLFRCYKSNLFTVFVAKDRIALPFDTLETFANQFSEGKVQLAYYSDSNLPSDIETSTQLPWIKIRQSLQKNPLVKFDTIDQMIANVSNTQNLAFRMAYMTYLSRTELFCNLSFVEISTSFLAFGFTKNSSLTNRFSKLLYHHSVSADHWDEVILKRQIRSRRCGVVGKKQTKKFHKLQISQMFGAFVFLLVGSLISGGLAMALETMHFWVCKGSRQ